MIFESLHKYQKSDPMRPKVIDFGCFGDLFWHQSSLYSTNPRKLNFATRIMRTPLFNLFQASHFGIKNQSKNHVFCNPFLGPHCSHLLFNLFQKWSILVPPFKIQAPQIDKVAPKGYKLIVGDSALCAPLFSRNHSNYCAVGSSWLLKSAFVRWRLAHFLFLLRYFVLCFIQHFYHFVFIQRR